MDDYLIKIGVTKKSQRLIQDWREVSSERYEPMDLNIQNSFVKLPHNLSIQEIFLDFTYKLLRAYLKAVVIKFKTSVLSFSFISFNDFSKLSKEITTNFRNFSFAHSKYKVLAIL